MATDLLDPRINVLIHGSTRPEQFVPLARLTEPLGFREVWLAEDYFLVGGFATSAMVLQATERVKVTLGVVPSVTRHPALIAMEIATLARAYPGRFTPGIGHGGPLWMKQMGVFPRSVLKTLQEAICAVRRLLAGETLTQLGEHFRFDGIQLGHPVEGVDIYAGVLGPKSLELAGAIADGVILGAMSSPAYVGYAKGHAEAGRRRANRTGDLSCPTLAIYAVDGNRTVARQIARQILAFYLSATGATGQTEPDGISAALVEMINRGGAEALAREMPEEWIDLFAIAGEPDECAERMRALLTAGATSVVLAPVRSDQLREQLELTAREVVPRL